METGQKVVDRIAASGNIAGKFDRPSENLYYFWARKSPGWIPFPFGLAAVRGEAKKGY